MSECDIYNMCEGAIPLSDDALCRASGGVSDEKFANVLRYAGKWLSRNVDSVIEGMGSALDECARWLSEPCGSCN